MNLVVRILSVVLCVTGYATADGDAKLGDAAAPLDIATWVKGDPVTIAPGETTYVVEFWATWCGPCRKSIPHLTNLQKQYRDKNVVFVGVSKEDAATVKPFVDQMGDKMDYTVAVDDAGKTSAAYMGRYGQNGIPTAFIVNKKGQVAWLGHPMAGLDVALDDILAGTYDIAAAQREMELMAVREKLFSEFMGYCQRGDSEKANALAEKMLKEHSASADLMNAVGWTLLTHTNKDVRNPTLALKIAKAAMTASKGKNPSVRDTYARALFLTGDVDGAIEQQKKAIQLAPEEMRKDFEKPLNEYLATKGEKAGGG